MFTHKTVPELELSTNSTVLVIVCDLTVIILFSAYAATPQSRTDGISCNCKYAGALLFRCVYHP